MVSRYKDRVMNDKRTLHKPAFNVIEPFIGTMMVQLNREMCLALASFIDGVSYVEPEINELSKCLIAGSGNGAGFALSPEFNKSYVLRLDAYMRTMLIEFIADIEGTVDKIVWALHMALRDPEGGREYKMRKKYEEHRLMQRAPASPRPYRAIYGRW